MTNNLASEGGHWYDQHGNPVYQVPDRQRPVKCPSCTGNRRSAAGKAAVAACLACDEQGYIYPHLREATLRDARRLGLCRGVTSIIRAKANYSLQRYHLRQMAEACYTAPPEIRDLPFEGWLARVEQDRLAHSRNARDEGTLIHETVERGLRGETLAGYRYADRYAAAVAACIETFGVLPQFRAEHSVTSVEYGYGCKLDAVADGIIVDWKTKDLVDSPSIYDDHAMQLAAQREAMKSGARCFIGFLDRKEPKCVLVEATEEDLAKGWRLFQLCLEITRIEDDYTPPWATR